MAKCGGCGSTILFGGITHQGQPFCDQRCVTMGQFLEVRKAIPAEALQEATMKFRESKCPQCGGAGPLDVHPSYFVWSAIVFTRSTSKSALSCRSCARKKQAMSALGSGVVGWWGIPFGLIMTPVQVIRNVFEMASPRGSRGPSRELIEFVRDELAVRAMQAAQQRSNAMAHEMAGMDAKLEATMDEEERR
jgi:endogenous inhibitor of DNA gyrase (YacG/DUF329 family)